MTKLLPGDQKMPNWCDNSVVIDCPTEADADALKAAFDQNRFCEFVTPMPEILSRVRSPVMLGPSGRACYQDGTELTDEDHDAYVRCGYPSWYDFACDEWGTKWDVGGVDEYCERIGTVLAMHFRSAWTPPGWAFFKLMERGFSVTGFFSEYGMDYRAGIWQRQFRRIQQPCDMPNLFWETLAAAKLIESVPAKFDW